MSIRAILDDDVIESLSANSSFAFRRSASSATRANFSKGSLGRTALLSRRGPFRKSSFFERFGRRFASFEVPRAVIRRREAFSIVESRRKRPRSPVFRDSRGRSISNRARTTFSTTGSLLRDLPNTLPLSVDAGGPFGVPKRSRHAYGSPEVLAVLSLGHFTLLLAFLALRSASSLFFANHFASSRIAKRFFSLLLKRRSPFRELASTLFCVASLFAFCS